MAAVKVYEPAEGTDVEVEIQPDGSRRQVIKAVQGRDLTERMFAKAPQTGYSLWLDTGDATYVYIAEAPIAAGAAAGTFNGIRLTKSSGAIVGKVSVLTGFVWNDRATVTWP